jgi:trans-aconitate 2-methyltransferase
VGTTEPVTTQGAWDGSLYAANSEHHRSTDDRLIDDLRSAGVLGPDARLLDLGCGHGDLTASVAALVPDGDVVGADASSSMVDTAAARHTAPNLCFVNVRAQDVGTVAEPGSLDAVVSVACLHWVPRADHPGVLAQLHGLLRPGGVLRADFGGQGQIDAVRQILDEESADLGGPTRPWYFPGAEEYASLVVGAGFSLDDGFVRLLHQRRSFPDAEAISGYVLSQTVMAYDGGMAPAVQAEFRRRVAARAVQELRRDDGSYDLDYVRVDLLARREP